jgi:hypothetical protein
MGEGDMKNYEEMSDFEINKAVAIIAGVTFNDDGEPVRFVECDTGAYADFNEIEFDPCNNPSDAWPIIVDNKISLTCHHSRGEWSAVFNAENICFHANNPLRAAMIVFLKMNEDK